MRAELFGSFSAGFAFGFVDGLDEGVVLVLGDVFRGHEVGPELAVAEADDEVFFGEAEGAEGVDDQGDELDVGFEAGFTDDVAVELVMFAAAAFLRAFVAVDLGDGEPLEGFLEVLVAGGDEAGERGGHFGAERDVAVALVLEVVELIGDFIAGLFGEEVEGFEGGAIVLDEAVAVGDVAPFCEDGVAERAVVGIEVAKSSEGHGEGR